jgi:mRNA-degrading endonuclease HigB of HigAB toxin-antitoxin module
MIGHTVAAGESIAVSLSELAPAFTATNPSKPDQRVVFKVSGFKQSVTTMLTHVQYRSKGILMAKRVIKHRESNAA